MDKAVPRRVALGLGLSALLPGCAVPDLAGCPPATPGTAQIWVAELGWHTEIGIRADDIDGPLGVYREIFPGARALMFGFGKRTFFTARTESLAEYVMGPFPGPGAVQVTGLQVPPPRAYERPVFTLDLPPGGLARLSAFLWNSIAQAEAGGPRLIAEGNFPGSLFYAATHGYALSYTCNTWVADGLRQAGLPVVVDGVVVTSDLLRQLAAIPGACRATGMAAS